MTKSTLSTQDILDRKNLQNIIGDKKFRVCIFGSARIKPEDDLYQSIAEMARHIAIKGYNIVTGGGPGAMEAASFGHRKGCTECTDSAKIIGINIELPFEQKPNRYLDVEETVSTFSARLDTFMVLSDVFIITPGGIGTLLELFYTWQLMQVGHICRAPIILWGEDYKLLEEFMRKSALEKGFVTQDEIDLTLQVSSIEQVLDLIDTAHASYQKLGDTMCINIKQYIAGARSLGMID